MDSQKHTCYNDARIVRNEKDIQTLFNDVTVGLRKDIDRMKDMRIANLSMQVLSLLGIIATIAVVIIK